MIQWNNSLDDKWYGLTDGIAEESDSVDILLWVSYIQVYLLPH